LLSKAKLYKVNSKRVNENKGDKECGRILNDETQIQWVMRENESANIKANDIMGKKSKTSY